MKTEPVGGMHFIINAFALRVFLAVYWEMANYKGSISAAFSRSGGGGARAPFPFSSL